MYVIEYLSQWQAGSLCISNWTSLCSACLADLCWASFLQPMGSCFFYLQLSSHAVVQAFIDRIKAVNPQLNAVVAERYRNALEEAVEIDKALDSGKVPEKWSPSNAPFLGVPFTAKEAFGVVGELMTVLSIILITSLIKS